MQTEKEKPSMMMMSGEIQKIADSIRSDVEKQLNHAFSKFQVMESHPLKSSNPSEPERSSYSMKIKTGDKEMDDSHLKLMTTRRDPFSSWMTSIDELFMPMSPFENMLMKFDSSKTGMNSIQTLADRLKKDVEKELNRSFKTFDVMDYHPIMTDPEHTSYYMRVKTDDNGHVRIKTIKKEPGQEWKTHVEEFTRGKPMMEGMKSKELEGKKEPMRGEMKGEMMRGTEKKSGMEVESKAPTA